jgi:Icc protein
MPKRILFDHHRDGIDRRGFLECMAWAGAGTLCVLSGGVLKSYALTEPGQMARALANADAGFSFVQISDSHIGFNKAANPDVAATLQAAIDKVNALPAPPAFILHTGDITQLSKPEEFDTADQLLRGLKTERIFFVPGEHDVLDGTGKLYRQRHAANALGDGWYSFDSHGAHFVGLVNVLNLKAGGLGSLGREQLEWLEKDLQPLSSSTPIVVFAHIPLWSVYPDWGWGTDDSAQGARPAETLRLGKRAQRSHPPDHGEGRGQRDFSHRAFHRFSAARSWNARRLAGAAHSAAWAIAADARDRASEFRAGAARAGDHGFGAGGKIRACADGDRAMSRTATQTTTRRRAALVRALLLALCVAAAGALAPMPVSRADDAAAYAITIRDFAFTPRNLTIRVGSKVTWTNKDEEPHKIAEANSTFASQPLDTDGDFSYRFDTPGSYEYFCTLHPRMTGKIIVEK